MLHFAPHAAYLDHIVNTFLGHLIYVRKTEKSPTNFVQFCAELYVYLNR
jgi:hypothetical protein